MMSAIVSTGSRMSFKWFLRLVPALALLGVPGAGAQERESVDLELSVTNRYPPLPRSGIFVVSVRNNSAVTVRNIRVQLEVEDLTDGRTIFLRLADPGSLRIEQVKGTVDYDELVWTIPHLRSGESAITLLSTDEARNADTLPEQRLLLRFQASIVESSPREDPGSLGNNHGRAYVLYRNDDTVRGLAILFTSVRYGVDADPDTDTFTVKVTNPNIQIAGTYGYSNNWQRQLRLSVTPSPGLRYTAAAAAGTSFNAATGIWDIGTLRRGGTPEGDRQLDIRVTGRASSGVLPAD